MPAGLVGPAPGGARVSAFRPEHVRLSPGGAAEVRRVEHLGNQTRLHIDIGGHDAITLTDAHTPTRAGDRVDLQVERTLHFDASGNRIS